MSDGSYTKENNIAWDSIMDIFIHSVSWTVWVWLNLSQWHVGEHGSWDTAWCRLLYRCFIITHKHSWWYERFIIILIRSTRWHHSSCRSHETCYALLAINNNNMVILRYKWYDTINFKQGTHNIYATALVAYYIRILFSRTFDNRWHRLTARYHYSHSGENKTHARLQT